MVKSTTKWSDLDTKKGLGDSKRVDPESVSESTQRSGAASKRAKTRKQVSTMLKERQATPSPKVKEHAAAMEKKRKDAKKPLFSLRGDSSKRRKAKRLAEEKRLKKQVQDAKARKISEKLETPPDKRKPYQKMEAPGKRKPYQKKDAPGRKKPYSDTSPGKPIPKKPVKTAMSTFQKEEAPGEDDTPKKVAKKPRAISTFQKEEAPGEGDTPKKVSKKKVSKPTNVNTGDAAYIPSWVKRKDYDGKSADDIWKERQTAKKKKKAAPSVDGRTKAVQDKEESMAGFAGDKPKEETADFKDFLSKHGGVKGFQFNLIGKNKTKEAGMKRAREAYAEEQRDRKRPGQSDHYQYGEGRRAVKKKGGAMRKSQGGTIRLKTGGAVIDTYDYN